MQGKFGGKQCETEPMIGRSAMLADAQPVLLGRITLVPIPAKVRMFGMKAVHDGIAVGLGEDGGRSDVHEPRITLYHAHMRDGRIGRESVAVHCYQLWPDGQLVQGAVHGKKTGLEDVDAVYLHI